MAPKPKSPEPAARRASARTRQETIGVVLGEQHLQAIAIIQELGGLSRSDCIRRMIDIALSYTLQPTTVLDLVVTKPEFQQKLLDQLQRYVDLAEEGEADLAHVRRVTGLRVAGIFLQEDRIAFEGWLSYLSDVSEGGARRSKGFVRLFRADFRRDREIDLHDLGPEVSGEPEGFVHVPEIKF